MVYRPKFTPCDRNGRLSAKKRPVVGANRAPIFALLAKMSCPYFDQNCAGSNRQISSKNGLRLSARTTSRNLGQSILTDQLAFAIFSNRKKISYASFQSKAMIVDKRHKKGYNSNNQSKIKKDILITFFLLFFLIDRLNKKCFCMN